MRNHYPKEQYYFPPRLKERLAEISSHPLTLVEAPSGFGKTTAVREFFEHELSAPHRMYWHTCFGEPIARVWSELCGALRQIDNETARYLVHIGFPTDDSVADVIQALPRLRCDVQTYLVIDNFQYIFAQLPWALIDVLSDYMSAGLHVIGIMQTPAGALPRTPHPRVHYIKSPDLFFTREDTAAYFRQHGFHLSEQDLATVQSYTEGWVAALRLQLISYAAGGRFEHVTGIDSLVKVAIWNHLSDEERHFLLAMSGFESFSANQAAAMLDTARLPDYAMRLLEHGTFIHPHQERGEYVFHNLLREFLLAEFHKLPEADRLRLWNLAGRAYAQRGLHFDALCCFYYTENYGELLALPLCRSDFADRIAESQDILRLVVDKCPQDILLAHPVSLTVIAFEFFITGKLDYFGRLCGLIEQAINRIPQDAPEHDIARGEYALLTSFSKFNDLVAMGKGHKTAFQLLKSPSRLYSLHSTWTFGQPSVISLYWRESGTLAQALEHMDEYLPYYSALQYNHGAGGQYAMRAEALLLAGDDQAAEPLARQALQIAAPIQQDSICYTAWLTLARIAILRGDEAGYRVAVDSMNDNLQNGHERTGPATLDMALAFLQTTLGSTDIPQWLQTPDQFGNHIYALATPFAQIIYARWLLHSGRAAMLLGVADIFLEAVERQHFQLPAIYLLLDTAVAQARSGRAEQALQTLERALAAALPDKVYLPFAEYGPELDRLLAQCSHPDLAAPRALSRRQTAGAARITRKTPAQTPLTPRESEVARLAAQGLSNREIAQELFLSTDTVKAALKRVFAKLGIRSRAQLEHWEP